MTPSMHGQGHPHSAGAAIGDFCQRDKQNVTQNQFQASFFCSNWILFGEYYLSAQYTKERLSNPFYNWETS